jgi:hypothetical protein
LKLFWRKYAKIEIELGQKQLAEKRIATERTWIQRLEAADRQARAPGHKAHKLALLRGREGGQRVEQRAHRAVVVRGRKARDARVPPQRGNAESRAPEWPQKVVKNSRGNIYD